MRTDSLRTVLLVHYHFLPVHNVGVKQFLGYAKYLPNFGWRVACLTRDWEALRPEDEGWGLSYAPELHAPGVPIFRAATRSHSHPLYKAHEWLKTKPALLPLRKSLSLLQPLFGEYPDPFVGWIPEALREGKRAILAEQVDAILSDCPVETNHIVASELARKNHLPWVAFFSDLYGFLVPRPGSDTSPWKKFLSRQMHHYWLGPCSEVLAVSPAMLEKINRLYGLSGDLVVVGYDPEDFPLAPIKSRAKLTLSHVGSLYPGDQRPELLFDATDTLVKVLPWTLGQMEIHLVGSKCEAWLENALRNRPSQSLYRILPKVPPHEAIQKQLSSDALLLFNCTLGREVRRTLSYPCKIFEYFGARRPILAIPGDGDWVEHLLQTSRTGRAADDVPSIVRVLKGFCESWQSSGEIPYEGRQEVMEQYSHRRQAEKIAGALDRAAGSKQGRGDELAIVQR